MESGRLLQNSFLKANLSTTDTKGTEQGVGIREMSLIV